MNPHHVPIIPYAVLLISLLSLAGLGLLIVRALLWNSQMD